MNSVWRLLAALLFFMLLPGLPARADSGEILEKDGKLEFSFGVIYVPQDLSWTRDKTEEAQIYVGRSATQRVVIAIWRKGVVVDNPTAMSLLQKDLVVHLENAPSLQLKETLVAPYPWAGSLELRLGGTCAYLGSEAEKALMVVVQGENPEATANAITGSFKESVSVRRQGQEKSGAARILSMLGTATTFMLLGGLILGGGVALFINRRRRVSNNPFTWAVWGLSGTLVIAILFNWTILSRFSWAGFGDYGRVLGDGLARYVFLLLIVLYCSRRWAGRS
ncbi:MAG: hypothetical protein WC314_02415 [Vulcanimicrobiota bacterium]